MKKKVLLKDFLNPENCIAINCRTEQESNELLKLLDGKGLKWRSGDSLIDNTFFDVCKQLTCYGIDEHHNVFYDSKSEIEESGYTICKYSEIELTDSEIYCRQAWRGVTMIDLTKFSKEVHQNAVAHGWWEPEPNFEQINNLCHEELSEALREYREGRPMEWYACCMESTACVGECGFCTNGSCPYKDDKPEGIAVEMVDCLLRILDYIGAVGYTQPIEVRAFSFAGIHNLMECIAELHMTLSLALIDEKGRHKTPCVQLSFAAGKIVSWLKVNYGENWEELMYRKHEYNKTREYRHGGKKA